MRNICPGCELCSCMQPASSNRRLLFCCYMVIVNRSPRQFFTEELKFHRSESWYMGQNGKWAICFRMHDNELRTFQVSAAPNMVDGQWFSEHEACCQKAMQGGRALQGGSGPQACEHLAHLGHLCARMADLQS